MLACAARATAMGVVYVSGIFIFPCLSSPMYPKNLGHETSISHDRAGPQI